MKSTKNFLSASIALAALLFISGNVSAMNQPTKQQVDNLSLKIQALEVLLIGKKLISQFELDQINEALGVVSEKLPK
jgi:hypothetical protein